MSQKRFVVFLFFLSHHGCPKRNRVLLQTLVTLAPELPLHWIVDFICPTNAFYIKQTGGHLACTQDHPFLSLRFCRNGNHLVPVLICYAFCFVLFCFVSLVLNKGQCVTKYYRWMQKNGGYIWIQSSATIAINAKNANEKNIIWVNYLLRYIF